MELSSQRFKAFAVSLAFSFWFFVITNIIGIFSIEKFVLFIIIAFVTTQILAIKVVRILNKFANFNTKLFLSVFFIFVMSLYGILFKILKIDLLRLKQHKTYWLKMEKLTDSNILKQY